MFFFPPVFSFHSLSPSLFSDCSRLEHWRERCGGEPAAMRLIETLTLEDGLAVGVCVCVLRERQGMSENVFPPLCVRWKTWHRNEVLSVCSTEPSEMERDQQTWKWRQSPTPTHTPKHVLLHYEARGQTHTSPIFSVSLYSHQDTRLHIHFNRTKSPASIKLGGRWD